MAETHRINVKLDADVRDRLDRFCIATHRNVTQSVNLLLGAALAMSEAVPDPNTLLVPPAKES